MKSEQRHQLQTNVLANQAGKAIEQAKPYTAITIGGIAVFALLGIGWAIWHNSSLKANSNAWSEYYFANGKPDQLVAVYEDYPTSSAAEWARQAEADSRMEEGLDLVFRDRKTANELFEKAKKNYEVITESATQPALRARATLGLAQAYESLGDNEKAIAQYKKLQQMDAVGTAMAEEVKRRLEWLNGEDAKSFFAWYKDFAPAPSSPLNLPPMNELPRTPDVSFPTLPNATPTIVPDANAPSSTGSASGATAPTSGGPANVPGESLPTNPGGSVESPTAPSNAPAAPAVDKPAEGKPQDK